MTPRTLSLFRITIQALFLGLVTTALLAACSSGSPSPVVETIQPASPTQAPAQALQPTSTQPLVETQAPAETKGPVETQASAPTPAQAAGSGISACALITKEEAEAALGGPVNDPVEQDYPPLYGCDIKATTGINEVGISLAVADDAKQAADAFQMVIDLNHYPEVSGIGDRAYRPDIMDIDVLKGRYDLGINVVNDEDKETRFEKAKALAAKALDRLP